MASKVSETCNFLNPLSMWHGGLMVSGLVSGSSGMGSSSGRGHCVVLLGNIHCASPPKCINGYWRI